MRIGDYVAWTPSFAGSFLTGLKAGWLTGLIVLVVGTTLTFLISDMRRAGGFAPWVKELVGLLDDWDKLKSRRAKRSGKRKEEALHRARRFAELRRERRRGARP